MHLLAEIIFWISFSWLGYIYIGYPLILKIVSICTRSEPQNVSSEPCVFRSVTVFIPAFNEATIIEQKIRSTLESNYPSEKLEVIVASDASTDATNQIVGNLADPRVRLYVSEKNIGKNGLINSFIPHARGELLIFTDANALFEPEAIGLLNQAFDDPKIDCIGGKLIYLIGDSLTAKGEGAYYKYENKIRHLEAGSGHLMGVNGALYAIRASAFIPVPLHVPNDFFHPLCILAKQRKVTFNPLATASEKATETAAQEFSRRCRIVTRALVTYEAVKQAIGPLKGRALFNYFSHRLLRWYGFLPITLLTSSALYLGISTTAPIYTLGMIGMIAAYLLLLLGWSANRLGIKMKFVNIPFYFFLINAAAAVGVFNFLTKRKIEKWTPATTTR